MHATVSRLLARALAATAICAFGAGALSAQALTPAQKSKLRNLKYYLESAEGSLRQIASFDAKRRAQTMQGIERSLARAGAALQGMPKGSPRVAPFAKRYESALARCAASKTAKYDISADSFGKEMRILRSLRKTLDGSTQVAAKPERFVFLGERWKKIVTELERIGREHATVMKQSQGAGWEMRRLFDRVRRNVRSVERAARNFCATRPKQLVSSLSAMEDFVERAVANKNHRVFGAYVARELQRQGAALAVLDAWGTDTKASRRHLAESKARMAKLEASLASSIVEANRAPADRYRAKDRAALEAVVRATWQKAHPKDEILGLRFPDAAWTRDKRLRFSDVGGLWLEDRSYMQVRVLVAADAEHAINCGVVLMRDAAKGGKLRATAQEKSKQPSFRILRKKLQ